MSRFTDLLTRGQRTTRQASDEGGEKTSALLKLLRGEPVFKVSAEEIYSRADEIASKIPTSKASPLIKTLFPALRVPDVVRGAISQGVRVVVSEEGFLSPEFNRVHKKVVREGYGKLNEEEKNRYVSALSDIAFGAADAPKPKLSVGGGLFSTTRFNVKSEVDDFLRRTAKEIEPEITKSRRGKVSWDQTFKDAEKVTIAELLDRKKGQGVSDSYIAAATNQLHALSNEITELTQTARNFQLQGKSTEIIENQLSRRVSLYKAIQNQAFGASAEVGRALNVHRALAKELMSPREQLMKKVLKEAGDWGNLDKITKDLLRFEPENKLGMIKYLSEASPSSPADVLEGVFYNNILSAPDTHLANTIGNFGRNIWHLATKPLRVGADVIQSKLSGTPREEFMREFGPELVGSIKGFRTGVKNALFALRYGFRPSDVQNLRIPKRQLKGKVGAAYSLPTRFLLAEDELFRGINRSMEIHRQAASSAIKEGLKGPALDRKMAELIQAPTADAVKRADELADNLLFMQASKELTSVGGLRDLFAFDIPKLGRVRPMRFVIPFVTTPLNIAKFAIEAGPVGLGKTLIEKGLPQVEKNRRIASGVLGTMTLAYLATHFAEENLTSGPPKSPKDRDAFYALGKQPYAVKVGDYWVGYSRFPEPIATMLTSIAAYHDTFQNEDEAPTAEQIGSLAGKIMRSYADRTFLSGIGDFVRAIEEPESYGNKYLQRLAASIGVPWSSFVARLAKVQDRVVRKPENIGQAILEKVPGLSEKVPARPSEFEPGGIATRKYPGYQEFLPVRGTKEVVNPEAQKQLLQSETIKGGKGQVVELLKKTSLYQSASAKDKARLEDGIVSSYSNSVRNEKPWNIYSYISNQTIIPIRTRTTNRGTKRGR